LHMAQLMPLPLTVSCFSKIQIGFTFLLPAYPGPGQRAVKRMCVCVSSCVCDGRRALLRAACSACGVRTGQPVSARRRLLAGHLASERRRRRRAALPLHVSRGVHGRRVRAGHRRLRLATLPQRSVHSRHGTGSSGHQVNGLFGPSFPSGSPGHHYDPL